jgi:soluble lytic murein transglycosylase-like protein
MATSKQRGFVTILAIGAGGLVLANAMSAKATPKKAVKAKLKSTTPAGQVATAGAKYAKVFGVPLSLLVAVIGIESRYKPNATNKSARALLRGGAWGYGQVTLSTAKDLTTKNPKTAAKYWPRWDGTGQGLLDPETNLAVTAFYLASLWRRYKSKPGSWLTTGTAYHQGPGNMDAQIAKGGGKLNATLLPPNGKTYYGWLKRELDTNQVVSSLVASERNAGVNYV